jgi:biotin carboxylase
MNGIKNILILGGGTMQIPAIKIAKKKGWNVIVADGNPDAEGKSLADYFENIDLKDKEKMTEIASNYKMQHGLDGVFTAGTDFSSTVAFVAESLKLPGISYETALNSTDKFRMRKIFTEAQVPSPRFVGLTRSDDPVSVLYKLAFPLVVKPVDNMGARGVRLVNGKDDLKAAAAAALLLSRNGMAIVEEYMEGPEVSVDAVVWRGQISICGIADRHIAFSPYFVELGHTMPTELPSNTIESIISVFRKGITSLGIIDGTAKGDIKITNRGPMIGEIAARLSGGYMSGWTYPYSSGVEVTEAALNIAVGSAPGSLSPYKNLVCAERAFISIPGKIKDISGFETARNMPKIKAAFLRAGKGKNVVFPSNNVEKCGNVISLAATREDAINAAEDAIGNIVIRLEPDNEETEDFILGRNEYSRFKHITAFSLTNRANIIALDQMIDLIASDKKGPVSSIAIEPLPELESEFSVNWHGQTLKSEFAGFLEFSGSRINNETSTGDLTLGRLFWNFFLKGGIQAALYLVDTITLLSQNGKDMIGRLYKWMC